MIWIFVCFKKHKTLYTSLSLKELYKRISVLFKIQLLFALLLYLLASTSYFPKKLIYNKERTYEALNPTKLDTSQVNYIHVLGSGFSLDETLYATQNLGLTAIGRLTEGVRIYHQVPNSKLVTSGYSKYNMETQASVAKKAAIEMGVKPEDILMLEEPSTTLEEVSAFVSYFGTDVNLIVASDATHLPRALTMYKNAGIEAIAAPTNFRVKLDVNHPIRLSLPKASSFEMANHYVVVSIKELYYSFTKK